MWRAGECAVWIVSNIQCAVVGNSQECCCITAGIFSVCVLQLGYFVTNEGNYINSRLFKDLIVLFHTFK